jgi:hypothetical protein
MSLRTILKIIIFLSALIVKVQMLSAQSLYWLDASFEGPTIRKSTPEGTNIQSISLDPQSLPECLAISTDGTIYWSELKYTGAHVEHVNSDIVERVAIFLNGSTLRGIAIDQDSNWIYLASSNELKKPHIERMHPDGSSHQTVLTLDSLTGNPRALSIDPVARKLYWTEFTQGAIKQVDLLPGAIPHDIITGLGGPIGLVIDHARQKIFWIEANAGMLKSSNLNGIGVTTLITGLASPNYLAVDTISGKLYWTEIGIPRIRRANFNGDSLETLPQTVTHPTGIAFGSSGLTSVSTLSTALPTSFSLYQNYPNPFNPSTTIRFDLPERSAVKLEIFNILGKRIAIVTDGVRSAGSYALNFDASRLSSGAYIYRLTTDKYVFMKKLLLIK